MLHLVLREFRIRYRRSLLGALWAVAQPVTRLAILGFLFTRVLPLGIPNYVAFLFVGLTGWLWFSAGVAAGTQSAVERRELLLRPTLPRLAVPMVSVFGSAVDYLFGVVVLLAYVGWSSGLPVTALALPALWAVQLLWMLGIAFPLCAANVYVRDVGKLVDVALLVGFYATPVFYAPSDVPASLQWAVTWNPMARILEMQRQVLLEGALPSLGLFLSVAAGGMAVLVLGALVYGRSSPYFIDEL